MKHSTRSQTYASKKRPSVTLVVGLSVRDSRLWRRKLDGSGEILDADATKWQLRRHARHSNQPHGCRTAPPATRGPEDRRKADGGCRSPPRAVLVDDAQPGLPRTAGSRRDG